MSYHCCVPNCTSDSRYDKTLSFHRFPPSNKKQLQSQWIAKIRRDIGKSFQLCNTRVCSKHFVHEDFKPPDNRNRKLLKEDVIPTIFPWSTTKVPRRKIVKHLERETAENHILIEEAQPVLEDEDLTSFELAVVKAENVAARAEVAAAEAAVLAAEALIRSAEERLASALAEIEAFKKAISDDYVPKIHKFGLERFSSDDADIKYYTGFPTCQHFSKFYEFVEPSAQTMTYVYSSGVQDSRPSARTMLLIDELFMFLVRIRLGLFEQDLADSHLSLHVATRTI